MSSISLEAKLKAIREVESIYALAKKWQRLVPGEKRPNWERIADAVLQKALSKPVAAPPKTLDIRSGRMHHDHDPMSARVIERTLRNGIVHPDVLHSYSSGVVAQSRTRPRPRRLPPAEDTPSAQHFVQHGGTDLQYPAGHLQGYGFVPWEHEVSSHVQLENKAAEAQGSVPSKANAAYA